MKKRILRILLESVFIAVFNLLFFLITESPRLTSVWISYGFIHFSYIMLLLSGVLIKQGKSSAVFGMTLYGLSSVYFIVEFVIGLIFIMVKPDGFMGAVIVQTILAAIYFILLLSNMIANEHTAHNEEIHERELAYVKTAALRLKPLISKASGSDCRKAIQRAYDVVSTSPTKSNAGAAEYEADVLNQINALEEAMFNADYATAAEIADRIIDIAEKRNLNVMSSY